MRLRKYLTGRRINGLWFNWQKPALCISFAPRGAVQSRGTAPSSNDISLEHEQQLELYLILDLNLGPYLSGHLPELAEKPACTKPTPMGHKKSSG